MIITNLKGLQKIADKTNSNLDGFFVYPLTRDQDTLQGIADTIGAEPLTYFAEAFVPHQEDIDARTNGDMSKNEFKKQYKKHLKDDQSQFLLYTLARGVIEKKRIPLFVTTDKELKVGFIQQITSFLTSSYDIQEITVKEYISQYKEIASYVKETTKKSKREKAIRRALKEVTSDMTEVSMDGTEALEEAENKFAIHTIAILINQTENPETINKKKVIKAIKRFSSTGKKQAKMVKRIAKDIGAGKKSKRWNRLQAIEIVNSVYNELSTPAGLLTDGKK